MAYNLYEERGYDVQYSTSIDEGVVCLSFKKLTPNYEADSGGRYSEFDDSYV